MTREELLASVTREELVAIAKLLGAFVLAVPGAEITILARAEASEDDLIPLPECAKIARASERVVKDAIRASELVAYGKKYRSVRRSALIKWIDSRRVRSRPEVGPLDDDIRRGMLRLAREERALAAGGRRSR